MTPEMISVLSHIVGFTASVVAFVLWLPQARLTLRLRHSPRALSGISLGTQSLLAFNALLWFGYGFLEQAFWIAAPGFINLPLACLTIGLVLRARRRTEGEADCSVCREGIWHKRFIIAPPGWGSTMSCDGSVDSQAVIYTSDDDLKKLRAMRV